MPCHVMPCHVMAWHGTASQKHNGKFSVDQSKHLFASCEAHVPVLRALLESGFMEMPLLHPALKVVQRLWRGRFEAPFLLSD